MPNSDDIKVVESWKLIPRFGYADINASRLIALDLSIFGYAMNHDSEVFHRPDCQHVVGKDDLIYSLSNHIEGEENDRQPCETCEPDRWDWEGEDGELD